MSSTQIDIIRSVVKGSVVKGSVVKGSPVKGSPVKDSLGKGSHARRATHATATQNTPATTTIDVEQTVNQISDLAKQERDGVSSGANGSGKKCLGTTGDSERDMIVASTHSSTEEQSETSTNGASGTAKQSAVQQDFATASDILNDMSRRLITDYPLVAGLRTLFEVVHAWYTGAFPSSIVFPASGPTQLWLLIIVRFGIGFILVKYRNVVERYMNHIRIALAALCLCVLVEDVVSGNVSWKTILTTGIAAPLLMYSAVVQKEAGRMVVMLR